MLYEPLGRPRPPAPDEDVRWLVARALARHAAGAGMAVADTWYWNDLVDRHRRTLRPRDPVAAALGAAYLTEGLVATAVRRKEVLAAAEARIAQAVLEWLADRAGNADAGAGAG
ncbi:hypothetical protein [Coralloluteibacterium thermophilus]|uniref:Uncharacterized protein n=1 Tax=Coralloluteibacterium thermophilum TaxID=2707049 RepID=A0ABV9NKJ6_9GAMM